MVEAGRMAARALLDATGGSFVAPRAPAPRVRGERRPWAPRDHLGPFAETTRA